MRRQTTEEKMNEISLTVQTRTVNGKKVASLRKDGLVPSVIYGNHTDTIMAQSAIVETTKVVRAAGKHSPVHLTIDGKKQLAIIKDVDFDPIKHSVRHIAFHAIRQNEIITTEVPLILVGTGESAAEKAGLVVLQAIEHIEVKAKPADLPESIEISIVDLATADDKITVGDITLPKDVDFADNEQDLELVIANVYEPSALQAANDAAGGDAEDDDPSQVSAENGDDASTEADAPKSE
jgi:large subunit ribosomal protein L25